MEKSGGLPNLKIMTPEEREIAVGLINKGIRSDRIANVILEKRHPGVWTTLHSEITDLMSEVVENA